MDKIWNIPEIQLIPLAEVHEARPVLLVTSQADWEAVRGKLRLPIAGKLEPLAATLEHWDTLIELIAAFPQEVVYAVGGVLAMDTAKYLAHQLTLPLVCIPTALDSDAFLTPSANVQQDGCVKTLQTEPAQMAVVDLETISAAPAGQRSRGLCSVLALATASFDWKLAEDRGKVDRHRGLAFGRFGAGHDQRVDGFLDGGIFEVGAKRTESFRDGRTRLARDIHLPVLAFILHLGDEAEHGHSQDALDLFPHGTIYMVLKLRIV